MTPRTRVSPYSRAAIVAIAATIIGALPAAAFADRTPLPAQAVNRQAAALSEFQARLDAYLELREELSRKVKPLSPTADSAELTARQEALATAMKAARAGAKQGDLVPKPVADHIAAIVAADRKRRPPVAKSAALGEVPKLPAPAINRPYPADAALPTVPPLLLAELPRLPDNLQYRFYGRHVVILDGDLQIITDFIANVLPPQ